jgi:uncharacterized protein (TIGR00255 family)
MIRSMTGYGKAVKEFPGKRIIVELRAVNSKQLDLNLKMPNLYREKELDLRSLLGEKLERGKVEVSLSVDSTAGQKSFTLDKSLAANYYQELKSIYDELNLPQADFLAIITRMPDVIKQESEQLTEEEWSEARPVIEEAVGNLDEFRLHEGGVLERDFIARIGLIQEGLKAIAPFEHQRIVAMKERIRKNMREFADGEKYDENRFEQELFYYIEKLDITEEKVRLEKHLDFFMQTMSAPGNNGKKLSFISQEIGREINTLGSKANDADIQKIVVGMKDELEKVKEQLLNIL